MSKGGKVAILQPNYIPWKGYFDIIRAADHFVFLDDVQYTSRDWRNRNQIKTPNGLEWLSIPVLTPSRSGVIKSIEAVDGRWRKKHWQAISQHYSRTGFFEMYRSLFDMLYLESEERNLVQINKTFIQRINDILGIATPLYFSSDFNLPGEKSERLLAICRKLKGEVYLSGPAAKSYLNENSFRDAGIAVEWMDYSGYPEYRQLYPPFQHTVTVLDLIFNEGPDARQFLKNADR
jgi:hypothetical protein